MNTDQYIHLQNKLEGHPTVFNDQKIVWIVTDYVVGDWEGSGYSYAMTENETFVNMNHGHCSCYGPLDEDDSGSSRQWELLGNLSDMRMHATGNQPLIDAIRKFLPSF